MIVRNKIDHEGYPYTEALDHDENGVPMASRFAGTHSEKEVRSILEYCRKNDRGKKS